MPASRREFTDLFRAVGGLLLASGVLALLIRKSGHHEWSKFARFLTAFIPVILLYTLAVAQVGRAREVLAEPWRSVLAVTAILLGPVAMYEFLAWTGASTRHLLYNAAVFALTGLLAIYATRRARVPYAALLAGLALLITWLLVWAKILSHPSADTFRWLLLAGAALLLLGSAMLTRRVAIGAAELATAGGVAAVAAGVFGVLVGAVVGALRGITRLVAGSVAAIRPGATGLHRVAEPINLHTSGLQRTGWDVYLLIVSVALVWVGSRTRVRGLGYVGGFGLLAFIISVGAQITRLEIGRGGTGSIIAWPLILLVLGIVALAASFSYRRQP